MKTTGERPHLQRGLPERGVSPSGWLQTVMAHRLSSPHPSTSHAKASERRSAVLTVSGSSGFAMATHSSQAKFPFPSGHILQGRPIDRSDPGRPAVPPSGKEHQAPERRRRGRSQRKSPRGNKRSQHPPTAHHLNPVPSQVPSAEQHPRSPEHPVSAHPPCSRKGPLLQACGLKRPRRVKRETTNSRFCGFVDLAIFLWSLAVSRRSGIRQTQTGTCPKVGPLPVRQKG